MHVYTIEYVHRATNARTQSQAESHCIRDGPCTVLSFCGQRSCGAFSTSEAFDIADVDRRIAHYTLCRFLYPEHLGEQKQCCTGLVLKFAIMQINLRLVPAMSRVIQPWHASSNACSVRPAQASEQCDLCRHSTAYHVACHATAEHTIA